MSFDSYGFAPEIMQQIAAQKYEQPTPIQAKAIPEILAGKDIMGLAQTGTGKTAAFVLPMLQKFINGPRGRVRGLVIAPTRELAEQIHQAITIFGQAARLRSTPIYGGVSYNSQAAALRQGPEIVVACPGRLLDHLKQGAINLLKIEMLVLDEADQMFDMGFLPDIKRILQYLPARRQTMLFSATMPNDIRDLAQAILRHPITVEVEHKRPVEAITHLVYPVAQHLKTSLLLELLKKTPTELILIFTRTKHRAKRLDDKLRDSGYRAASLQGNLSQNRRQAVMQGFRQGEYDILVATDIAARGIDVSQVSHVINFDFPDTAEAYTHRIGRTGRASRKGDAYSFVTPEDVGLLREIEKKLGQKIGEVKLEGFDYNKTKEPSSYDNSRERHSRHQRRPDPQEENTASAPTSNATHADNNKNRNRRFGKKKRADFEHHGKKKSEHSSDTAHPNDNKAQGKHPAAPSANVEKKKSRFSFSSFFGFKKK